MAIRNVLAEGADEPQPLNPHPGEQPPRRKPLKERYVDALGEGLEIKGLATGLGIDPRELAERDMAHSQVSSKAEESVAITILKGQQDMTNTLIKQLATQKGDDPFMKYIIDELRATKARLDSPSDPFETLAQHQETMTRLASSLKEHLGIPQGVGGSGAYDMSTMVELEKIRTEREQRSQQYASETMEKKHQYDLEHEDRQRRYVIEDRHWEQEFQLKKSQLESEGGQKEEARKMMMDLGKAVVDSIDDDMESDGMREKAAQRPPTGERLPDRHKIQSFKCEKCGGMVPVTPGSRVANCVCGAEFDLVSITSQGLAPNIPNRLGEAADGLSEDPSE